MTRLAISVAAVAATCVFGQTALAQSGEELGARTGVTYADPNEEVDGPKTIAGSRNFESPVPFFKDLKPWDPNYKVPRTSWGVAELGGVWSTASLTTMARGVGEGFRPKFDSLVIPPEKVSELMAGEFYVQLESNSQRRTDPRSGAFTDGDPGAGYNHFWVDPGSEYAKVDGEYRSSWITSPADGKIPYSQGGNRAVGSRMNASRSTENTGPEIRTLGDRCLVSFANQGGPPLNNSLYNNNVRIVQTPEHVLIEVEMNHDARIVRLRKPGQNVNRLPDSIEQWFGDSIGWWEGDTLVVETSNVKPLQARGRVPLSKEGRVIERFRRVSDLEIDYTYEVIDPVNYTQTWTGQMPLRKSTEQVYEYACHEGNYAMTGILLGMAQGRDTALDAEGE